VVPSAGHWIRIERRSWHESPEMHPRMQRWRWLHAIKDSADWFPFLQIMEFQRKGSSQKGLQLVSRS